MENYSNQQPDPIAEKMRDTVTLEKIFKQAVFEAVDKARRLGFFLPHHDPVQQTLCPSRPLVCPPKNLIRVSKIAPCKVVSRTLSAVGRQ